MPVTWINNIVVNAYSVAGPADSFQGIIAPGCKASATVYYNPTSGASKVPPLYWSDPGGIGMSPNFGFIDKFGPPEEGNPLSGLFDKYKSP